MEWNITSFGFYARDLGKKVRKIFERGRGGAEKEVGGGWVVLEARVGCGVGLRSGLLWFNDLEDMGRAGDG
jgi:hypothetical protein